jgi:hypothetical protein
VRNVLDTWDLRTPRLGDADGEDRHLAAVLAVTRLDHPALAVAARPGPAAAVADGHPGALGEGFQVALHLRTGRVVRGAVHHRAHECPVLLLFGEEAVPVVALVLARPFLEWCVGLCPREESLEEGPLAEHAARVLVRRNDGVLHAEALQGVADLKAAGSAAD